MVVSMVKQNTFHAVMAQRFEAIDSLDDFPTPPWATRALCEKLSGAGHDLASISVWEPACGRGHMARPLAEYFRTVYASDIHQYGHGAVYDFLKEDFADPTGGREIDAIITNPPFRLAEQFARIAISRARVLVALLVRTGFLESTGRHTRLFGPHPPSTVLQFTERVPMVKGRCDPTASTATSYAWLVWRPGAAAEATTFEWIPSCRAKLVRPGDYCDG
jgi:hypothetical protein